jgi:hypothetical protein
MTKTPASSAEAKAAESLLASFSARFPQQFGYLLVAALFCKPEQGRTMCLGIGVRPFGTWLLLRTRGIEESIFEIPEPTMKAQQGGGLQDDGGAQEPTRAQELRNEPKEHTVGGAEIGRSSPRPPYHQKLLFEEEILREHGPDPTTSQNSDQTGQQA